MEINGCSVDCIVVIYKEKSEWGFCVEWNTKCEVFLSDEKATRFYKELINSPDYKEVIMYYRDFCK